MSTSTDAWAGRAADETAWLAYRRYLLAEGKSPTTVYAYRNALEKCSRALPDGITVETMTAEHVTSWLADGAASGWVQSSLASYSRKVRTYCTWAAKTGYAEADPMTGVKPVREQQTEIPVPDVADVAAVAALVSKGKDFESLRDWAIMCVLSEVGTPRASEVANLTLDNLDLRHDSLSFMGKGGKERTIALGAGSCRALTLYLRARGKHRAASSDRLFLGYRGEMTRFGIRQMLKRRCEQAEVAIIPPHHWRHLTAHLFMEAGGSVVDAMKLFGWSSPMMATRYDSSAASARAVSHARQMSLGDKILAGKVA